MKVFWFQTNILWKNFPAISVLPVRIHVPNKTIFGPTRICSVSVFADSHRVWVAVLGGLIGELKETDAQSETDTTPHHGHSRAEEQGMEEAKGKEMFISSPIPTLQKPKTKKLRSSTIAFCILSTVAVSHTFLWGFLVKKKIIHFKPVNL